MTSHLIGPFGLEPDDARDMMEEAARAFVRGTPEHAAMFACRVCGQECPISPGPGQAICEKHCEDHDYEYVRGEGHHCKHCFAERPWDWGLD
jgi:hypothetical protein